MTPKQIMRCRKIVSVVPGDRKADAIYKTLTSDHVDPMVPATLLVTHPCIDLFIDEGSAALCDEKLLKSFD